MQSGTMESNKSTTERIRQEFTAAVPAKTEAGRVPLHVIIVGPLRFKPQQGCLHTISVTCSPSELCEQLARISRTHLR
jgi:hypothetical protein